MGARLRRCNPADDIVQTTLTQLAPGGLTGVPVDVSDTGLVVGSTYGYGAAGPTPQPTAGGAPGSYTWQCRP